MKILNQIRYFLFATTVLGCFANFAQNEYGLSMLYYSMLIIGIIFFIEAFVFYNKTKEESLPTEQAPKTKAIYLFTEHFLIGCIFLGQFFKWEHVLPPGPFLIFGAFLLFILYFIYAIRMLTKESKKGRLMAVMVFFFVLATAFSVNSLSWKLQHLPGSNVMMKIVFFFVLFLMLIALIKRKYTYNGELISLKDRVMKIPGKMPMVFTYFTLWIVYISLITFGLAPNFYTLSNPPAFEKLKQANSPKEGIYVDNYYNFLENRNHIQYR